VKVRPGLAISPGPPALVPARADDDRPVPDRFSSSSSVTAPD
jgi:hypothetical protein